MPWATHVCPLNLPGFLCPVLLEDNDVVWVSVPQVDRAAFLSMVKPQALVGLGQPPGPGSCPGCNLLVPSDGRSAQLLGCVCGRECLRWPFPARMCHTQHPLPSQVCGLRKADCPPPGNPISRVWDPLCSFPSQELVLSGPRLSVCTRHSVLSISQWQGKTHFNRLEEMQRLWPSCQMGARSVLPNPCGGPAAPTTVSPSVPEPGQLPREEM